MQPGQSAACCMAHHGLGTGSGRKEGLRGLNAVWHIAAMLPGLYEFVAAGGLWPWLLPCCLIVISWCSGVEFCLSQ